MHRNFEPPPPRDDTMSTVTKDGLLVLRKKFFFPTTLEVKIPGDSDKARSPPSGYFTIYEMNLRGGLRFPLPPELVAILTAYSMCISQLSSRTTMIIMGLISFFRGRKATLTPDFFARLCKLSIYAQDRIICKSRSLEFITPDAVRNWASRFFYVKNDWGVLEQWGPIKEHPLPIGVREEDVLKALDMQNMEELQFKIRHLNRFIFEGALSKVGISSNPGKSRTPAVTKHEKPIDKVSQTPVAHINFQEEKNEHIPLRKRKERAPSFDDDSRIHIPNDVMARSCLGFTKTDAGILQVRKDMKEWNAEFVKIKYLYGEFKRKYISKSKELQDTGSQLSECRIELSTMATSLSLQRQEVDRSRDELIEARTNASCLSKGLKVAEARVSTLEAEVKSLHDQISQNEILPDGSKVIDDFKKSYAFKTILADHAEQIRARIFQIEVKDLERQCLDEGFIRGFLKGIRLARRKPGVMIEDLTPSQASEDPVHEGIDDDAESAIHVDDDSD